jgi:hypothetical protein
MERRMQSVMPQVKHTKMLQVADLSRYFGQVVIGQNEGLDFKILPCFVRHMTEVLLPEVEIHAALKRHIPHFRLLPRGKHKADIRAPN